jgi:hypothetical protein
MRDDRAATLATFADFKLVKSRKLAQLVFELPIEQADAALKALGGLPNPASEAWCGIARVQPKASTEPLKAVERPRKRWEDLTPAQRAGIRCGEPDFSAFIIERFANHARGNSAADFVREYCEVGSRALIEKGTRAEQRWNLLESSYQAWLTERQYAEVIR